MAGHIAYVHTIVPAPPEAVWDVIADVGNADRIYASVTASRRLDDGPLGVGSSWEQHRALFGHHGREVVEVVACEPPRLLAVRTRVGHDVVRTSYRLSALGEDGDTTRLALTVTLGVEGRTALERFSWENFGEGRYERTHKMLERDLDDVAAEVARRRVRV